MTHPRILREAKRSEYDWQAYENLYGIAERLKVRIAFYDFPPYLTPAPKDTGFFSRTKAGRKLIELTKTFNSTTSLVMTMAHEIGHALSCTSNVQGFYEHLVSPAEPCDVIYEEELAWALGEMILDEIGYVRSSSWLKMKFDSLTTYYRTPNIEAGRRFFRIDISAIILTAQTIRTSAKVVRLLPNS